MQWRWEELPRVCDQIHKIVNCGKTRVPEQLLRDLWRVERSKRQFICGGVEKRPFLQGGLFRAYTGRSLHFRPRISDLFLRKSSSCLLLKFATNHTGIAIQEIRRFWFIWSWICSPATFSWPHWQVHPGGSTAVLACQHCTYAYCMSVFGHSNKQLRFAAAKLRGICVLTPNARLVSSQGNTRSSRTCITHLH